MQVKTLFSAVFFASLSYAQLQILSDAISSVQAALGKIDAAVQGLDGSNIQTALALQTASSDAQTTIKQAATNVQASQPLSLQDAIQLQTPASDLQTSVQNTVTGLTGKKAILDGFGVTQIAVQSLKDQKVSAQDLGKAIVEKVPSIGQSIAQQSVDQIGTVLDQGITQLGGTPNKRGVSKRSVHFRA